MGGCSHLLAQSLLFYICRRKSLPWTDPNPPNPVAKDRQPFEVRLRCARVRAGTEEADHEIPKKSIDWTVHVPGAWHIGGDRGRALLRCQFWLGRQPAQSQAESHFRNVHQDRRP